MIRNRRSYSKMGGGSHGDVDKPNWEPKIDKDPFYRTMDIFNGVFKKKIRLAAGKTNCTDLHTIFVNFGESKPSKIVKLIGPAKDTNHSIFLLECGHEWEGKNTTKNGGDKIIGEDYGMCGVCGSDTIYRGFEHEWQHIIFKTDLAAKALFCTQYAEQLVTQYPGVDKEELIAFLHQLVNAFDDIRINSLWEKVYPGSALAIWDRWRYFTYRLEGKVNTSFLCFIFAVAFDIPTNQSEFESTRPVVEWAIKEVKYRGFNNMLLDVRIALDRCMGLLLSKTEPPKLRLPPRPAMTLPPPPSTGGSNQDTQQGNENGNTTQKDNNQNKDQETNAEKKGKDPGQENDSEKEAGNEDSENGQLHDGRERSGLNASLRRLMKDPQQLDPKEDHMAPTVEDLDTATYSQTLRASLSHILNLDIDKLNLSDISRVSNEPDAEMQAQITQLQNSVVQKSEASQLTDGSRAKISLIPVTTAGTGDAVVELTPEERTIVQRLRAAFFRSMGKQKAKRSSAGVSVDVEAAIQYSLDYQDPNIFDTDDVNQGFAYSIVCDMSGSMRGTFPVICNIVEMLKQALDYPFVKGNLWGFRGGDWGFNRFSATRGGGEVWLYQYSNDVNWYTGTMPYKYASHAAIQIPVQCGGITPMNSAINVATSHLWRKMPSGMAKRMFLLTDGSPVQSKVTGQAIPDFLLRQFVANEIQRARKHGIEVYTMVIGHNAIPEDKCLQMFGPRRFWRRVGTDVVGKVLLGLVLQNFTRYLRRA